MDPEHPAVRLIQSGNLSTDTLMANEGKPDHYRYYDLEKMTDLEAGDTFETQLYSMAKETSVDLSLTVAGCITREEIAPWLSVEGQFLYGIVSSSTREKIEMLMGGQAFSPECHLVLKETEGELMERLKSLTPGENQDEQQVIFVSREQSTDGRHDGGGDAWHDPGSLSLLCASHLRNLPDEPLQFDPRLSR